MLFGRKSYTLQRIVSRKITNQFEVRNQKQNTENYPTPTLDSQHHQARGHYFIKLLYYCHRHDGRRPNLANAGTRHPLLDRLSCRAWWLYPDIQNRLGNVHSCEVSLNQPQGRPHHSMENAMGILKRNSCRERNNNSIKNIIKLLLQHAVGLTKPN